MQADEVLAAVRQAGGPFAEAKLTDTLEALRADSLDRVELALALEGQFDIILDDATVEGWGAAGTTIGDVAALVINKVAN